MRPSFLFFSFISLLFAILIIFLGVVVFLLPRVPHLLQTIAYIVISQPFSFHITGFVLVALGVFCILAFHFLSGKYYYQLEMQRGTLSISPEAVSTCVQDYLKTELPQYKIYSEVSIEKNKIEIIADFPNESLDEHIKILERIELGLSIRLKHLFGYDKQYLFTVYNAK